MNLDNMRSLAISSVAVTCGSEYRSHEAVVHVADALLQSRIRCTVRGTLGPHARRNSISRGAEIFLRAICI